VIPTIPNNKIYEVTNVTGTGQSGGLEPTFPTTVGEEVVDNDITWTCREPRDVPNFLVWQALSESEVKVQAEWNEYFILSYNGTITQI
jgi:hypothetical protein